MWNVTKAFEEGLQGVLLTIDSVIYWFVGKMYGLFVDLASARIFEQDVINAFANRIYNLVGVVMLFVIAYSILTAIVDPSKFSKGETSFGKIVMNVVTSLILLAIVPTLFDYAYSIQNMLITNNVMGSLLLGQENTEVSKIEIVLDTSGISQEQLNEYIDTYGIEKNDKGQYVYYQDTSYQTVKAYGNITAFSVLNAFLNPDNTEVISSSSEYVSASFVSGATVAEYISCGVGIIGGAIVAIGGSIGTSGAGSGVAIPTGIKIAGALCVATGVTAIAADTVENFTATDLSWSQAAEYVKNTGDFNLLASFAPQVTSGEISYTPVVSTICGLLLLYIILSFCLDLGVRAVKLVFYQLIAPIPILLRVVPKEGKIFNNWTKAVLATYFEVFVRLAIIYMITYLASNISALSLVSLGAVGKAVIIMGLVAFAKEAPKLISEVTGISSGNMKLGIRDKLAAGGALLAGAAIGAGVTAFGRNAVNAWKNTKGGRGKKIASALKSGLAGGGSAFVRGGYAAKGAKSYADVRASASKGATGATKKALTRASYKEKHNGSYRAAYANSTKGTKFGRALDAMQAGVIGGHLYDAGENALSFFGVVGNVDQAERETKVAKELSSTAAEIKNISSDFVNKHMQEIFVNLLEHETKELKSLHAEINKLVSAGVDENHVDLKNAREKLSKFSIEHSDKRLDVIKAAAENNASFTEELSVLLKDKQTAQRLIAEAKDDADKVYLETNLKTIEGKIADLHSIKAEAQNRYNKALKDSVDGFASTVQWMSGTEAERKTINLKLDDITHQLNQNAASSTVKGIYSGSTELNIKGLPSTREGHEAAWVKAVSKMAEESERINQNLINQEKRRQAEKKNDK